MSSTFAQAPLAHSFSSASDIEPGVLRGTPAAPGHVTGRARIVRRTQDAARLRPGEILVCRDCLPAWRPLLSIAAGAVTEHGGTLSSLATTAREYGIPVVVALRDATTRIREGQLISIDGSAGVVCFPIESARSDSAE